MKVPRITSDWTFLDVKIGRAALCKLVDGNFSVPVTIEGNVIDSKASGDDGTSQEFTVEVTSVRLGKPQLKPPQDMQGRPYVLAKNVKAGDTIIPDGDFTCMKAGTRKKVRRSPKRRGFSGLYVACRCGGHYLHGQLGYTPETEGALVGFYPA